MDKQQKLSHIPEFVEKDVIFSGPTSACSAVVKMVVIVRRKPLNLGVIFAAANLSVNIIDSEIN